MRPLTITAALAIALTPLSACAQQPAPTGPVDPVADAPPADGYTINTAASGLNRPWAIAFLPSEQPNPNQNSTPDALITERPGTLRLLENGALRPDPLEGLPDILAIGQGGLMDVSLHPNFNDNRLVYLTYTTGTRNNNRTALGRGTLSDDRTQLQNFQELFRVSQTKPGGQHFGSRILWLDDTSFLLAIGDGGNPPVRVEGKLSRQHAQDKDSHLGKVLTLHDDGTPHPDNPFASSDDPVQQSVYTLGHRNIQGIAIDPETRRVYATEHGARGGDELNLIEPGNNYGWPDVTYSIEYWGPRIADQAAAPGMTDPLTVWTPCIAPCGLIFYTGDKIPQWQGHLLAGGLIGEQVRIIELNNDASVKDQTQINTDARIRDVEQGPRGYIYLLTDETDGKLLRIEPEN